MVKKIAFSLFILITVVLMSATIIEKFEGISFIHKTVYTTWWFYILWGCMAIFSFIHIYRSKLHKEFTTFLLHLSFGVILLGAIVTALTSEQGNIYLEKGDSIASYRDDDTNEIPLPFTITLTDLEVVYYSGTSAAADYISQVTFETIASDKNGVSGGDIENATISMNNIAKYKGYRFYQTDYDNWGSRLTVNRDVYGIPITYTGYSLLVLSLILILTWPKGAFRRLLCSPLLRKSALVVIIFIPLNTLSAATEKQATPQTLSKQQVDQLTNIQVVYNDRVMPLTTLAHDFTLKLTGDTKYRDINSDQFFWGWLLFPSEWENEAIFDVPSSPKQQFLQLKKKSSYLDFFTEKKVYKLNHYIRNTEQKSQAALLKELKKLNEKVQLVAMLRSGAMVKIFPYKDSSGKITWYSPIDELPREIDSGQAIFIKNSIEMLTRASASKDSKEFDYIASKIVSYQQKYGEESLLESKKVKVEQLYYQLPTTKLLYRFNLLLAMLSIILLMVTTKRKKVETYTTLALNCAIILSISLLTIHIALKWYITDRIPLINGYDTMVFLAWAISLITLLISRNSPLFTAMGTLLVGFTMLVATIGGSNPQITPLMPVLNSPYLTTHVCCIMLSYALFAFTLINGILALTATRNNHTFLLRLTLYSRLFLILGISFLAIGIFIGAVWANVSWGRYWAWDPKEVWALITMMLYSLPLHTRSLSLFRNPKTLHIYLIIAFLSLLMTYFGVNYLLGGMHSYAN